MGTQPVDIAGSLETFFSTWVGDALKTTATPEGVQVLATGMMTGPILAFISVGEIDYYVNNGDTLSDAIAKVGCGVLGGLAAAAGIKGTASLFDLAMDNPYIAIPVAAATGIAAYFGTESGIALQTRLSNLFASPTSSNILLGYLSAPTGFTDTPTPTPGGLAGTYNTTTSQSIATWQFTPVTASAVQQAESSGYYVVQAGNTLSDIAKQFGTTMEALMEANPDITNSNMIYAGQQITLPTSTNTTTSLDPASYQFVNGNLVSYTDSTGATTKYGYDSNYNLTSITDPSDNYL